jgi:hypothetical protein
MMKINPTAEMSISMKAYRIAVSCVLMAVQDAIDKGNIDKAMVLMQQLSDDHARIVSVMKAVSTIVEEL